MKKLIIATSIAVAFSISATTHTFASAPLNAETTKANNSAQIKKGEKNTEIVGFGSGAVAGAIVGGPIGAFIGGIFGLVIADDINSDAKLALTNAQLKQAEYSLTQQQQSVVALQSELQGLQAKQMVQLVSYEQQNNNAWLSDLSHFETNLQFKTASFKVEETYKTQLDSLARILTSYPELSVKVTGFADQRGDSDYNQQLSQQRADAVATYLGQKNVAENQIKIVAAGEENTHVNISEQVAKTANGKPLSTISTATPANALDTKVSHEDLFFSRRVNISLMTPKDQMTAAN